MVAPGHCSPSRKVVSKMTTRSFSDWVFLVVMELILLVECAASALYGIALSADPPSAQARMPSRPSGADKEKERAQNEGGRRAGVSRRLLDRANICPRRHGLRITLVFSPQGGGNSLSPR